MPARLSSMELSDPAAPATPDATSRRKSGRVSQKPVLFAQDPNITAVRNGSAKRKRVARKEPETEPETQGEESGSDEDESEPDEEEVKEKKRKAPKTKKPRGRPAAKKPKTSDGTPTKLAMRPAANGVRKPRAKKARAAQKDAPDDEGTGLYCRH
jgi:cohesin complex subunit SA-1/2